MPACPLLRMSLKSPSARRTRRVARVAAANPHVKRKGPLWLAVLLRVAGLAGLYQLEQLLNAIPDSNDDFGCF